MVIIKKVANLILPFAIQCAMINLIPIFSVFVLIESCKDKICLQKQKLENKKNRTEGEKETENATKSCKKIKGKLLVMLHGVWYKYSMRNRIFYDER